MIEFKNINKYFSRNDETFKVLDDINLTINDKDIFGIIGYSGAGKSTLIRLINALEKPTSGQVLIDGKNLADYDNHQIRRIKRKMGMIFQGFNLLETKTVAENIEMPLVLSKVPPKERDEKVNQLLEFVELSDKKYSYPSELSGGQKQRVSIARALINKPDILLCDEATSALDPQTTRSILDLLVKINKTQNVTIVLVTHEMSVVKHICNNVLVMEKGKIIEQGSVFDIFKSPKSLVTRKFINSVIYDKLPKSVSDDMQKNQINNIFRLEFLGPTCKNPVISDAILRSQGNISISILFSNMINIKEQVIGYIFVSIEGSENDIKNTVKFFKEKDVYITKLNEEGEYV